MSYTPGPLPAYLYGRECGQHERVWIEQSVKEYAAREVARAVAAERERCAAEMEALRVDALRYRWLRDDAGASAVFSAAYWNTDTPADFDAAIDAELDPQRLHGKGE